METVTQVDIDTNNIQPDDHDDSTETVTETQESTFEIPEKFRNEDGSVNTEALLKSYTELEKSRGKPKDELPDGLSVDGEPSTEALEDAGVDVAKYTAEFAENGELSDASREEIKKTLKGVSDAQIDTYIQGLQAMNELNTMKFEGAVYGGIEGGKDAVNEIREWIGKNYTAEQKATFNAAVSSGRPEFAIMAIQQAQMSREKSSGTDGSKTMSSSSGSSRDGAFYTSHEEYMTDLRSAGNDYSKREAIERKLDASVAANGGRLLPGFSGRVS